MNGITKWIVTSYVIPFLMRQFAKWESAFDWSKFKADWEPRIRQWIPGEFLDDAVVQSVNALLDAIDRVLSSTNSLQKVISLAVEQKFAEAWTVLRDLLLSQWNPSTPWEQTAFECVKDIESCPVFDLKSVSAA